MEELVFELKRRPIPDRLRLLADNLEPVLKNSIVNMNNYLTVLGTMTSLRIIADEIEENEK